MSKGLLGKAMTLTGNFITPAQISANANFGTITIDMENTNMNEGDPDSDVFIYICDSATTNPSPIDKVGRAIIKAAGGHATIDCGLVSAGEKIMVFCTTADIAVRVTGIEDITVVTP